MFETPSNDVDLELLRTFTAVAEHGSFSKAAKALGVSKATTSRAIARLEGIIGAELLHRDTHSVSMSTAGEALFERALPHLMALKSAVRDLPERRAAPSGLLRLTTTYDFGITVLPTVLAQFSLRFPEVTFDVRVTNTVTNLVADGFDLSIRAAARGLSDSSLIARKLGPTELRFYGSPRYLARRGEPRDYGAGTHEWIVFRPDGQTSRQANAVGTRFVSNDLLFVRGLLLADAAIGALPPFVAEEDVRTGRLIPVLPARTLRSPGGFYVVYPAREQTSRKVAVFRDFLVSHLKAKPLS